MDKRKAIFIVEDDPGFNLMMTTYLAGKNKWEIHSFESGEECLKQLDLHPVIFLQDFDLPGINGIEVMKRVKKKLPETEFIFLSAQTDVRVVVEAVQLGSFDYIVKDNYAKENALNKIDQVMKIRDLLDKKRTDKKNNNILMILLIISVLILILTWVSRWI